MSLRDCGEAEAGSMEEDDEEDKEEHDEEEDEEEDGGGGGLRFLEGSSRSSPLVEGKVPEAAPTDDRMPAPRSHPGLGHPRQRLPFGLSK